MKDAEIIKVLIKAIAKYTYSNIEYEGNREYYKQGIIDSLRKLDDSPENLIWFECQIENLKARSVFMKKRQMFSYIEPRKYYVMALDQVLSASQSIHLRFINGSLYPSARHIKSDGVALKGSDIFDEI